MHNINEKYNDVIYIFFVFIIYIHHFKKYKYIIIIYTNKIEIKNIYKNIF